MGQTNPDPVFFTHWLRLSDLRTPSSYFHSCVSSIFSCSFPTESADVLTPVSCASCKLLCEYEWSVLCDVNALKIF